MPSVARGFSMIELMVGIAIVALLLALGLPSLSDYQANAKIRNTATLFNSSVQMARAEAIRLNGGAEIALSTVVPTAANKDTASLSNAGPNWMVRSFDLNSVGSLPSTACNSNASTEGTPHTPSYTLVEGKAAAEGSQRSDGSSPVVIAANVCRLVFTGLGGTWPQGTAATFNFSNPSGGACAADGGPMRCLRVQVSAGGQARQCDPAVATTTDARYCGAP